LLNKNNNFSQIDGDDAKATATEATAINVLPWVQLPSNYLQRTVISNTATAAG